MYFWGQKYQKPPHPLFPRQTRVRIYCAANGGIIWHAPRILFTRKAIPDLVPMAGKRTED